MLVDQPAQVATFDCDVEQSTRGVAQRGSLQRFDCLAEQLVIVLRDYALAFTQTHQEHTLSINTADLGQQ